MIYILEPYYFHDKDFPQQKAEHVVATAVSEWAVAYEARLIAPKQGTKKEQRSGKLEGESAKRRSVVEEIIDWLHANSATNDLFYLKLYAQVPTTPNEVALFDHHDTGVASWALNLTDEQFTVLKKVLKENNFPEDLFYPEKVTICQPAKWLGIFPYQRCYSPKQWEQVNKNKA